MTTTIWAVPILPGRAEAWRRFTQEMLGSRRAEYIASRCRLGIRQEAAWLTRAAGADLAILSLAADDPKAMLPALAASDYLFDAWYREQWLALHGCDLAHALRLTPVELIYEWPAPRARLNSTNNLLGSI